jgi:hypothetical protein
MTLDALLQRKAQEREDHDNALGKARRDHKTSRAEGLYRGAGDEQACSRADPVHQAIPPEAANGAYLAKATLDCNSSGA